MFVPSLIDKIYTAVIRQDAEYIKWYLETIEKPFFDLVVSKYGWHLAHKAALEFFGYGKRCERFPHAQLHDEKYESLKPVLQRIKSTLKSE